MIDERVDLTNIGSKKNMMEIKEGRERIEGLLEETDEGFSGEGCLFDSFT